MLGSATLMRYENCCKEYEVTKDLRLVGKK